MGGSSDCANAWDEVGGGVVWMAGMRVGGVINTRVAAVIPCYNDARFLSGAVESVLGQTRRLEEVIVVDDGSTDETRDIVRGFEREVARCGVERRGHGQNHVLFGQCVFPELMVPRLADMAQVTRGGVQR